jgi:hypothetical protein
MEVDCVSCHDHATAIDLSNNSNWACWLIKQQIQNTSEMFIELIFQCTAIRFKHLFLCKLPEWKLCKVNATHSSMILVEKVWLGCDWSKNI